MGTNTSPETKNISENSSPSSFSSSTTCWPPLRQVLAWAKPSSAVPKWSPITSTPLPPIRPSAFTTKPVSAHSAATRTKPSSRCSAGKSAANTAKRGLPANLFFRSNSRVKPLLPSSRAEDCLGPMVGMPASQSASAAPATIGASGPSTASVAPAFVASWAMAFGLLASGSSKKSAPSATIPGLAFGAACSSCTFLALPPPPAASARAMACSRAPPPTISTLCMGAMVAREGVFWGGGLTGRGWV